MEVPETASAVLSLDIPVVTVHGEASRVVVRLREPDAVEFWYAEIRHGVVPMPWLNAWVTQLTPRMPGRFGGVVLSAGPSGEVLLSIPPEIIDHSVAAADLVAMRAGSGVQVRRAGGGRHS